MSIVEGALLVDNKNRINRLKKANIPDGAVADTLNVNHGTKFTESGIGEIRAFLNLSSKKMALTKEQEVLFVELAEEGLFEKADISKELVATEDR